MLEITSRLGAGQTCRNAGPWALRGWALVLASCALFLGAASAASATTILSVVASAPSLTVGQTAPESLTITNVSTAPEAALTVTLDGIALVPSCGAPRVGGDCPPGSVDLGVLAPSATAVGEVGTACAGVTFTISAPFDAQGKRALTSSPVVLGQTGTGAAAFCVIDFTVNALRTPTLDAAPGSAGLQTDLIASASGDAVGSLGSGAGGSDVTIADATPAITSQAAPLTIALGAAVHDSATLSGAFNPTGTVTFSLFGPDNATCTGAPTLMSVNGLTGAAATSDSMTPVFAGTYRFTATYSGDANNAAVTTACGAASQTVVVVGGAGVTTLATQASPAVALGGVIHDTATLSGGANPTGTITFTLFGPDDATCARPALFTSAAAVAGGGATSANFTPVAAGTYRWRASYSGDGAHAAAALTACADPSEAVVVSPPATAPTRPQVPLVVPFDSSPTTVRVSRSGRFAYALRATPGSTGTVRLRSTRKVRVGSRKRFVQVPATRFIAGATGGATVTLKLSSASLRTLERLKKLRFTVSVVVGGGSFTATLTLRAPKTR